MASKIASELKAKSDAAAGKLTRQLQGMEAYMERSDAPGQWTTREVLSHLGGVEVEALRQFLG